MPRRTRKVVEAGIARVVGTVSAFGVLFWLLYAALLAYILFLELGLGRTGFL